MSTSDDALLGWLKAKLEMEFEMSNVGPLELCHGLAFEKNCSAHTITISQCKYIEEVLKRSKMEESKLVSL